MTLLVGVPSSPLWFASFFGKMLLRRAWFQELVLAGVLLDQMF
jgi:hypothetical protein